jgi:hypothetical protein
MVRSAEGALAAESAFGLAPGELAASTPAQRLRSCVVLEVAGVG